MDVFCLMDDVVSLVSYYVRISNLYLTVTLNLGIPVIGLVGNMTALRTPFFSLHFCDNEGKDVTQRMLQAVGKEFPEGGIISVADVFEASGNGPEGNVNRMFQQSLDFTPKRIETNLFCLLTCIVIIGMAKSFSVPYLGSIPLDPNLLRACENGVSFISDYVGSAAFQPFVEFVAAIVAFSCK